MISYLEKHKTQRGHGEDDQGTPTPIDPSGMNTGPQAHRMGRGSHFTGGMVRLGHPVSTLDLIVECRIHHHARVGCTT